MIVFINIIIDDRSTNPASTALPSPAYTGLRVVVGGVAQRAADQG